MTDTVSQLVKLAIARRISDSQLVGIRNALADRADGHVYACPYCRARVFTVNTFSDRAVHFRHEPGVECSGPGGGIETWLHWQAKKAFRDRREILLPVVGDDGKHETRSFDSVVLEKTLPGCLFRPDAIGAKDDSEIAVEFAVTHFCEPAKMFEFMTRRLPAIEVDLSAADVDAMTTEELDDWILFVAPRKWITPPAIAVPDAVVMDDIPEMAAAGLCGRPGPDVDDEVGRIARHITRFSVDWGDDAYSGFRSSGWDPRPRRRQPPATRPAQQETSEQAEARWARNRIKARYLRHRYGDEWSFPEHWNRGRAGLGGWTITPPEAEEFEDVADWKVFETKAVRLRNEFGEDLMWDHWNDG